MVYSYCRCLASSYGWGSWPQLLFWFVNFYFFNLCSLMANNEGHVNPRAQAIEEVHFDWKCIVCSMVALSPLHLEQQHLLGTESVYFDLDNTPWVKCDKCQKLTAISFLDGCVAPGATGVDSTLLISLIHICIVSTLKFQFVVRTSSTVSFRLLRFLYVT